MVKFKKGEIVMYQDATVHVVETGVKFLVIKSTFSPKEKIVKIEEVKKLANRRKEDQNSVNSDKLLQFIEEFYRNSHKDDNENIIISKSNFRRIVNEMVGSTSHRITQGHTNNQRRKEWNL